MLLFRPIVADPEKAAILVRAMCVLHNYLRSVNDSDYTPPGFTDSVEANGDIREGFWRAAAPAPVDAPGRGSRSISSEAAL